MVRKGEMNEELKKQKINERLLKEKINDFVDGLNTPQLLMLDHEIRELLGQEKFTSLYIQDATSTVRGKDYAAATEIALEGKLETW